MSQLDTVLSNLVRVGTLELPHRYAGSCPDGTQSQARDPLCAACKALKAGEEIPRCGRCKGVLDNGVCWYHST